MTDEQGPSNDSAETGNGRTWRDVLRPFVHGARRLAYRLAHPWRRRRAIRLVRKAAPVGSVAFICLGNICRSPYAAAAARARAESRGVRVLSAGLLRGGRPCPEEAVEAARERGLDLQAHRSQGVERGLLEDVDLAVVMDPRQRKALLDRGAARPGRILVLGDLDPSTAGGRRTIPDPYDQDLPVFRDVYDRIDRCMAVLHSELENG
jgi:protein-tyrosine-phosphatase